MPSAQSSQSDQPGIHEPWFVSGPLELLVYHQDLRHLLRLISWLDALEELRGLHLLIQIQKRLLSSIESVNIHGKRLHSRYALQSSIVDCSLLYVDHGS
ncbi:hypothetical protein L1987_59736 [Smallanthus sonchifolius]|uniref:Uncharacterized protein n=1 Tax=Smallanthus sonchifolius TaxID=185202 RepID=A0ACB9D654_9ASTR|nr:hypothetical protein L1987_59736 [Smallanthus sonchifolius]